ncbi:MAG: sigma-70 family RNA polymerase sigma factor [Bacteroidetes bacterium]|nr:sigma-70 family RNA polymerase sigma factor [Bacteroidota bacterium]MBS1931319.1 sigma-70 family RNA polymerase sigma factor [Bacteroidota bacterium]
MVYFSLLNAEKYQKLTDQQLLDHFYADHNNEWLGILLQRYTLLLLGLCMKYLKNEEQAKDSVQQVFLKVITEVQKYKVEYFKSWIYMVAKNHCLMILRDRQWKTPIEISEKLKISAEEGEDKQALLLNDHILDLMADALKELNPEQQQCVTLFYLNKKSYQEISDTTGYNLLQVKSYIQNGKRNLRLLVDKKLKKVESRT